MPYITREDGEHFVIPSYRDVLAARSKTQLKKDILTLSESYGEYISMRSKAKGSAQFEVAFSTDPGYLLGESVWDYFKRPEDLIYCEVIPNTSEVILVIVKNGSVYLDGSFPAESIPEELVIFLTQQNNFEIYVYGDVPISQTPTEGKFSFDASSVRTYTVLEQPAFPNLPLLKIYQLLLVEKALAAQGIGVFPLRQALIGATVVILGIVGWIYMSSEPPPPPPQEVRVNPFEGYFTALASPAPDVVIQDFIRTFQKLSTVPGWTPSTADFTGSSLDAQVTSGGSSVETLMKWANDNGAQVTITKSGFFLSLPIATVNRPELMKIYPLKDVLANLIDRLVEVYPGNNIQLGEFTNKVVYRTVSVTINISDAPPLVLSLIGKQLKDLPFYLESLRMTVANGNLTGTIILQALGS